MATNPRICRHHAHSNALTARTCYVNTVRRRADRIISKNLYYPKYVQWHNIPPKESSIGGIKVWVFYEGRPTPWPT